jgi:putative tricarboxylic transport membrane protein
VKAVDIATALILLALSAGAVVSTSHLAYWDEFAPGTAFIVRWVAVAGALLGLLLLVQALRSPSSVVDWPDAGGALRVGAGIVALIAFLLVVPVLGTAVTASLFMLALLLVVQRQKLVPSLIATVLTVALIEGVFDIWLGVGFPKGVFGI